MEASLTCINFVVYMYFIPGLMHSGLVWSHRLWRCEGFMQDLSFLMLLFDFIPG